MVEKFLPFILLFIVSGLIVWMVSDKYDFERKK